MDKLDRWAEDRRLALKAELDELDQTIKNTKRAARLAPNLDREAGAATQAARAGNGGGLHEQERIAGSNRFPEAAG